MENWPLKRNVINASLQKLQCWNKEPSKTYGTLLGTVVKLLKDSRRSKRHKQICAYSIVLFAIQCFVTFSWHIVLCVFSHSSPLGSDNERNLRHCTVSRHGAVSQIALSLTALWGGKKKPTFTFKILYCILLTVCLVYWFYMLSFT